MYIFKIYDTSHVKFKYRTYFKMCWSNIGDYDFVLWHEILVLLFRSLVLHYLHKKFKNNFQHSILAHTLYKLSFKWRQLFCSCNIYSMIVVCMGFSWEFDFQHAYQAVVWHKKSDYLCVLLSRWWCVALIILKSLAYFTTTKKSETLCVTQTIWFESPYLSNKHSAKRSFLTEALDILPISSQSLNKGVDDMDTVQYN